MKVASMTGFGRASGAAAGLDWSWELKSVNGRTLDVRLKLPSGLERLEPVVRRLVAQACQRGSIQVSLTLIRSAAAGAVRINEDLLLSLYDRLNGIAEERGLEPVSLEALLSVRGVLEMEEGDRVALDDAKVDTALTASLEDAIAMLGQMRQTEGAALHAVLSGQLDGMAAGIAAAAVAANKQGEGIRQRLQDQVRALVDADTRLDPQRLHQEAVLLATRADVREELDRFSAHVAAARDLLNEGGAIGRRLDFLAQELGRETNTICSKAGSMDLTTIGLDLKSLVEQFREQVQNVE